METIYHLNRYLVDCIGAPHAQLNQPWVKYLCTFNGVLALLQYIRQTAEKSKFPTPKGERKIAAFNVMNDKYVGYLRWTLFAHILGGMTSQLGSSLAILLENYSPQWSKRLAKISSAAETFVHAPTAFVLTPFVYGDPGVVPYLYGTVSFLLQVSGLSALEESWREEKPQQEVSTTGKSGKSSLASSGQQKATTHRPELRRMCSTVSIFLYVRLYAIMRGTGGFLRRQKYSMAVMTAGTAMMPVGWSHGVFPMVFWLLMFLNRKTARETLRLVNKYGVDGAAGRQEHLA
jgi:hypothetical protein